MKAKSSSPPNKQDSKASEVHLGIATGASEALEAPDIITNRPQSSVDAHTSHHENYSPSRSQVVKAMTAIEEFPIDAQDHLIGGDWVKDFEEDELPQVVSPISADEATKLPKDSLPPAEGALQSGELAHPWTWDYFGMYYQYFCIGLMQGSLAPLMYPVFSYILGMPSYTVKGGYQVMTMWWSFKIFIGAFSDCFPIIGLRRKPYIVGGWTLSCILLAILITFGQPKRGDEAYVYLLFLSAITLCYVIGDVAMDSYVTDQAQREPIHVRGHLQSTIYTIRYVATSIIGALMAFGFSSKEYGGHFGWAFTLPQLFGILLGVTGIGLYPYFRLKESNEHVRKPYFGQFALLYERIKLNAVWRVIAFSFLVHFFAYFSNAASFDVARQWCHVEPWVESLFGSVLASLIVAAGVYVTKRYFINTSWRLLLFWTIIGMAVLSYIPSVLIDLGYVRSQFFYVGAPLANQFIFGIFFIVCTYCAVEVAEKGSEGITFGLITTVGNLSIPFTNVLSAVIAAQFDIYAPDGTTLLDTPEARKQMLYLDTLILGLQLLALPTLYLLPPQKEHVQRLIHSGRKSPVIAAVVVLSLVFCLLWSCTGNFLQIFASTSCLKMVGGKGC